MKILVVGLGNPVLGDDGVGWRVAEAVESRLHTNGKSSSIDIDIEFLSLGGLSLMERLIGFERVILIDAINTGQGQEGDIYSFNLQDLPSMDTSHLSSTHDTSLQNALKVGHSLGAELPEQIHVIAIEARNMFEFSELLSPPVAAAVQPAAQMVLSILDDLG